MVVKLADRVSESAQATGTGSFTLGGPSETQYISFATAFSVGDRISYVAVQGDKWEVTHGTLLSETLLSRDFVWNTSDQSGINSSNIPESSLPKISFDSGTTITIFVALPSHLVLALDENGDLLDPTPFRNTVYAASLTAMKAMTGLSDGETVICLEPETGGIFTWDATDSTAADNIDTFRIDSSSGVGLLKRVSLRMQASFNGSMTVDAAAAGDSYIDLFTAKKASNATKYFRWFTDAANSAARLGARLNQSGLTNFLSLYSTGDNADRVAFDKPSVLATRSDAQGIKAKTLAFFSGVSKLALAVADAADNTTEAAYKEIPLTKGGFIVSDVIDVYALKQVDPVASAFADGDRAIARGSNTSSGSSSSVNSGNTKPLVYYWASTSTASADDIKVVRPSVGNAATGNGRWLLLVSDITKTMTSGDATPTVKGCEWLITAGSTAITNFTDGYEGQTITVERASADIVITHDPTKINLGGSNRTLTAISPRASFRNVGGVWKSIDGADVSGKVDSSLVGAASGLAQLAANSKHKPSQVIKAAPNGSARLLTINSGWKAATPPLVSWRDVCWSPYLGLFAAVGDSGTGTRVMTSPDGINWTTRTSTADITWNSICWSEEKKLFVAVGAGTSNGIMTSPDGITWTTVVPPSDNPWSSVCWAPEIGLFCAIASSGTNRTMTSPDGVTWTARSLGLTGGAGVCWSPEQNLFVAVGTSGTNRSYSSPDGTTWTAHATADDAATWRGVCWANRLGLFVAVNDSSTGNRVMTSPDGTTWTSRNSVADNAWQSICWAEDQSLLVAVANSGTGNRVMTSSDAIVWTAGVSTADVGWNGVAFSPSLGVVCAISNSGTDRVMATAATTYLGSRRTAIRKVNSIADMQAIPDLTIGENDIVEVAYRSSYADGGGGEFIVRAVANNSFPVDNLGCVYASAGSAYVFIRRDLINFGMVNVLWFGADRTGVSDASTPFRNWVATGEAIDTQGTTRETSAFKPWFYVPSGYYVLTTAYMWYPQHNNTTVRGDGWASHVKGLSIAGCRNTSTSSLYFLRVSDICLDGGGSAMVGISLGHPFRWASGLQTASSFSVNVTTTAGSANATVASATGIKVGMPITSANIPFGSTIGSISGTNIVITPPDNQSAGYGITAGTAVSATIGGNNYGGPQEARLENVKLINFTLAGYLGTRDNMSKVINCYMEYNKHGILNVSGVDTEFSGCHTRYNDYDGVHNQPWQGNDLTGALFDLHGGFDFNGCTSRGNGRHNYYGTGGKRDTTIALTDVGTYAGADHLDFFQSPAHPAMSGASSMYVGDWWETYHVNCSWANYTNDTARWVPRKLNITAIVNGITTPTSSIRVTSTDKHYFYKNMLLEAGMVKTSTTSIAGYDMTGGSASSLTTSRQITDVIDEYTFEISIPYVSGWTGTAEMWFPNYESYICGQEKNWDPKSIKDIWFDGSNTNFVYFGYCQDIHSRGCRYKNQIVLGPSVIGFEYDMFKGITPDVTDETLYIPITGESALDGWYRSGLIDIGVTSGVQKTGAQVGYGLERPYSSGGKNADGSAAVMNTLQVRGTFTYLGAFNRLAETYAGGVLVRGSGNVEINKLGTAYFTYTASSNNFAWSVQSVTFRGSDGIITIGSTATSPGASSSITVSCVALNGPLAPINAGGYQVPAAILNRVNTTGIVTSFRYNGTEYGSVVMGATYAAFVGINTAKSRCRCTYTGSSLDALDTTNAYNVTSIVQDGTTAGKVTITFPARPDANYDVFLQHLSTGDPRAALLTITSKTTTTVVVEGRDASNVAARVPFSFMIAGA